MDAPLHVYIDTEFTDPIVCDLISMGLVADTDNEFYGENHDFNRLLPTKWVENNVYPLLNLDTYGDRKHTLSAKVWSWFDELPADSVIIKVDNRIDFELLQELFDGDIHPKIVGFENIFDEMLQLANLHVNMSQDATQDMWKLYQNVFLIGFHEYFVKENKIRHHALSDAKAIKNGYNFLIEFLSIEKCSPDTFRPV